jgi:cellulose synthase/poly-beta-1,6-N-acetylglucosamine synthase-like glycosyltransferase
MLIFAAIYIFIQVLLLAGFLKYLKSSRGYSDNLKISVITASRNEADNIKNFILASSGLDYPSENFELIIVDDNSTDDTYKLSEELIGRKENFRIIHCGDKSLPAKRGALLKGIEESSYPYIMITDADCIPSSGWLRTASALFEQGYNFIFGSAPLLRKENNFISSVSCMENLKNHFLSFSLASLGLPYTAAARSMGFSKEAFFKIGGYNNTLDTLSGDDDLLLREAVRNKLKIKAIYDEDALVFSHTPSSLTEYMTQKTRHTQSSFHYLFKHKLILSSWHLLNLFMIFSPVLMIVDTQFIWVFSLRVLTAMVIFSMIQGKFGYKFNPLEMLWYDIICEVFIVFNFFNALFRKPEWKQNRKDQPG